MNMQAALPASDQSTMLMPMTLLKKVAYFSMEMAIDQSLHTYSGGLGFLSGSHMISAGNLGLPMTGVSILWKQGYGDQIIDENNEVQIVYKDRSYAFLKDTGVEVDITIYGETVKVKALLLEPETFGTCPCYFLTTDVEANPQHVKDYTNKLYDSDERIRVAQEIILGVGGVRALSALGIKFDLVHMNEGHALPAAFELLRLYGHNYDVVRSKLVFTTHTPVPAGNEVHHIDLLNEAGYFVETHRDEACRLGGEQFSLTVAALRLSRLANGVSQLHGEVAQDMWKWVQGRCQITAVTNATNLNYWQDKRIRDAKTNSELVTVKNEMRKEFVQYVKEQTGKQLDPEVFTIVWARRFTAYKRADLIFRDMARIKRLLGQKKVQIVFAGKFHPKDTWGKNTFNKVAQLSKELEGVAIIPGYELELSGHMKRGADLWLNTPLRPMEASGTSGMSANFNGTLHMSTDDGWAVEGTFDCYNGFIINPAGNSSNASDAEVHQRDYESMMDILEGRVLPMFYEARETEWANMMKRAIQYAGLYFDSDRMAIEYYTFLYQPAKL
jgi:glycogen phosphorylase